MYSLICAVLCILGGRRITCQPERASRLSKISDLTFFEKREVHSRKARHFRRKKARKTVVAVQERNSLNLMLSL
jgi:hypothetical protein